MTLTFELVRDILGWCTLINIAFLLVWWLMLVFLHDFVFRMHTKWFPMSEENFNKIHYAGAALYKVLIFAFNLVPYLAMRIVG